MTVIAGDRGVSTWSYTYPNAVEVRGCDVYEFDGDRIRVKDAYRKVSADITRPFLQDG